LVLGIDCSGETYSVGLWSSTGLSLEAAGFQPRKALREISTAIAFVLTTAGVKAGDLSAVGVTQGPGSFTGVRLGITVAKTTAMVAKCPVCPWDTLELLAHQGLPAASLGTAAVALDARRGELYCGLFRRLGQGASLEAVLPTDVREPAQFQLAMSECAALDIAVGSGFEAYPDLLNPAWSGPRLSSRRDSAPSGLVIAQLSAAHPERNIRAQDLSPVYHRRADIQVQPGPG
jgi:tRNA threonylcarbamoyladenosine biosynthesis protein TsaB